MDKKSIHVSVLLQEVIDNLKIRDGGVYVDATLGGAGHAEAICRSAKNITFIGIDADANAIEEAKKTLSDTSAKLMLANVPNNLIGQVLSENNIEEIDGCMFDLGMSSDQLDTSGRGFSFQRDEPLLMTMKSEPTEEDLTAKEIVNTWAEESIRDILYGYGDESFASRIAKKIIQFREEKKIETTFDLVEIIKSAVPGWYRNRKTHPATKTFQALRIATNSEIENLRVSLKQAFLKLSKGGRIAVITFHSIEDRLVKHYFRELKDSELATAITKKPILPSREEVLKNPRSRSAKLRVIEKK